MNENIKKKKHSECLALFLPFKKYFDTYTGNRTELYRNVELVLEIRHFYVILFV